MFYVEYDSRCNYKQSLTTSLQPIPLFTKIYQRLFNYIEHNSEYINGSTQHIDLPTNFVKTITKTTPAPTLPTKERNTFNLSFTSTYDRLGVLSLSHFIGSLQSMQIQSVHSYS